MKKSRGLTKKITVAVKPEDKEFLEKHCQEKDISMSDVVRSLIRSLKSA
jgi:Arc/MetJ-type ribon-helix-helix transcriptional regulator